MSKEGRGGSEDDPMSGDHVPAGTIYVRVRPVARGQVLCQVWGPGTGQDLETELVTGHHRVRQCQGHCGHGVGCQVHVGQVRDIRGHGHGDIGDVGNVLREGGHGVVHGVDGVRVVETNHQGVANPRLMEDGGQEVGVMTSNTSQTD